MKRLSNFHPILIGIFPILQYYSSNRSEALLNSIWFPLGISLALVAVLWGITYLITKKKYESATITSILLIYAFSYQHFFNAFESLKKTIDFFPISFGLLSFILYTTLFVVIFFFSTRIKNQKQIAGFLSVVGAYLVIASILRIIPAEIKRAQSQIDITATQDQDIQDELNSSLKHASENPDIYYIIPDRYANEHVLQEKYYYDNSEFIAFLKSHDFYVADQSYANYPKTFLSLASSLNLRHITDLTEKIGKDVSDNTPVFEMVQNNIVSTYLKDRGYQFIYFGSWWEPTRINRHADLNVNLYAHSDEFIRKFGQTSILNPIFNHVLKKGDILGFSDNRVRENHLYQFEKLKTIAQEKSPKFVFVHILAPHSPYVLDENCNVVDTDSDNKDPGEYVAQLQCSNKQLKEVITNILAQSKNPPIIILQSDEGPFDVEEMNKHGEGIDWTKVSDDAIRHHMRILNAYHLPDFNTSELRPNMTPVNSFRLVFNHYFGTNFESLPDTSYIIPHLNYPYQYIEKTDVVEFK